MEKSLLDELNALFAEELRSAPPHHYVRNPQARVKRPDFGRMAFDAGRFRWLMTQKDPVATLEEKAAERPSLDEWRNWIDAEMKNGSTT